MFQSFPRQHGVLADRSGDALPSRLSSWSHEPLALPGDGVHFGYVDRGPCRLRCASGVFEIQAGMYFSVPGEGEVSGPGSGVLMTRIGERGVFMLGGPVEGTGRLRYIDGCTDSLLIPPVTLGDPCLNLLHIPPHTDQSQHTHPSIRMGMILGGAGRCVTPSSTTALEAGMVFLIETNGMHSFATEADPLLVLAWHPDSDFGPTDEDHPMLNRTLLPAAAPDPGGER